MADQIMNVTYNIDGEHILRKIDHILEHQHQIIQKLNTMANSITELTAKVDALQTALDEKQAAIAAAIAALKELVVVNGTEEERQILSDKIDAIFADVQSTPTE